MGPTVAPTKTQFKLISKPVSFTKPATATTQPVLALGLSSLQLTGDYFDHRYSQQVESFAWAGWQKDGNMFGYNNIHGCYLYVWLAYFRLTNINFKLNKLIDSKFGAETAQWLERWTRDRKVSGSSLGRSSGTIFFLQGQLWVLTLISVSVPIVRKRSRSFCQMRRWQVTAKHACTLRTWICVKWRDMVHGCMVYTKSAPRRQQFHVALAT